MLENDPALTTEDVRGHAQLGTPSVFHSIPLSGVKVNNSLQTLNKLTIHTYEEQRDELTR